MRAWFAAIGAAFIVTVYPASAASPLPISAPDWVTLPADVQTDRFPALVGNATPSGAVEVRCHRYPNGELDRCVVASGAPATATFGLMAVDIAIFSRAVAPPNDAFVATDKIQFTITFNGEAERAWLQSQPNRSGHTITNPDWKTRPNADDLARVWPVEATRKGVGGTAVVICYVNADGLLDRCRIRSENPADAGFGNAAILLTRYFSMRPKLVDGVPVGGALVVIPMNFVNPGSPKPVPEGEVASILNAPLWAMTPTLAQVDDAFPKSQTGKTDIAHVVLRCRIRRSGDLFGCETAVAEPHEFSFTGPAYDLIKRFRLDVSAYLGQPYWDYLVDIPITLAAPGKAAAGQITDPVWTRTIDPTKAQALYPPAAATAGVKKGRAVVSCQVDHQGGLSDCAVVSEDPQGLGFGAAAVSVANVMALNPWTPQGRPVDGAHIRIPLVLNLSPTDSATAPKVAKP
jgi:TonB family protein